MLWVNCSTRVNFPGFPGRSLSPKARPTGVDDFQMSTSVLNAVPSCEGWGTAERSGVVRLWDNHSAFIAAMQS